MANLDRSNNKKPSPAFGVVSANSQISTNSNGFLTNNKIEQNMREIMNVEGAPVKMLSREIIYANPQNKKYMRKITEEAFEMLKLSILETGLMHNLVVLDDGKGKYRLISGEKRWTAICKMTKEDYDNTFPDGILAKVLPYNPNLSKRDELKMLLTCNVLTFSNGYADPEQLRDLIRIYMEDPEFDKNELAEYLSGNLQNSKKTAYKLINEARAIEELVALTDNEVMNRAALQCLGGLTESQQKEIYNKIVEMGYVKIDQELAQQLKRDVKKEKSGKKLSGDNVSEVCTKYSKSIDDSVSDIEKRKKMKKTLMTDIEIALIDQKIENMINLLKEERKLLAELKGKKNSN